MLTQSEIEKRIDKLETLVALRMGFIKAKKEAGIHASTKLSERQIKKIEEIRKIHDQLERERVNEIIEDALSGFENSNNLTQELTRTRMYKKKFIRQMTDSQKRRYNRVMCINYKNLDMRDNNTLTTKDRVRNEREIWNRLEKYQELLYRGLDKKEARDKLKLNYIERYGKEATDAMREIETRFKLDNMKMKIDNLINRLLNKEDRTEAMRLERISWYEIKKYATELQLISIRTMSYLKKQKT